MRLRYGYSPLIILRVWRAKRDTVLRRSIAKQHMHDDEYPITLTTFPRLGTPGQFTLPYYPPSGPKLRSQFVPDEIANPHIRFPTLAANIRSRRGRKVQVNVPIFKDKNVPEHWIDPTVNYNLHNWPEDDDVRNGAAPENYVHMDAMAFGMGSCCLQITFQAKNITEGRQMYDQLSPLGPILLALTAATPIYKGFLVDTDVRWNQISKSVDCRTPEELGEKVRAIACNDNSNNNNNNHPPPPLPVFALLTACSPWNTLVGVFPSPAMRQTLRISLRTPDYVLNT